MVYCGKPSRACHACRSRKTRCDARPDGCTPCERAHRICPGYRSQIDLMFRDQSTRVIQKAKELQTKKSTYSNAANSASSLHRKLELDAINRLELATHRPCDPLSITSATLEERATCHFVYHFIVGVHPPSQGILDNLSLLYQSNAVDETLLSAIRAVSFANYGHYAHSSELVNASRYHYTKAINFTNTSLRCSSTATKDTTLLAITILSLYEMLTGCNQRSLKAWMEHIRGSSALVKLRGYDQLKTPAGRRLFIQATTGIMTSCIQLNVSVPRHVMEMVKMLPGYMDVKDASVDLSFEILQTMLDANQFRAAAEKGTMGGPHTILGNALSFDRKLTSLFHDTPPEFRFHTLHTGEESDVAFHGSYHVYTDLTAANLWNAVRVFRILLHQTIRETLLRGFSSKPPIFTKPEHTAQFQLSTDACYELQAEILASAPQHLGYVKQVDSQQDSFDAAYSALDVSDEAWIGSLAASKVFHKPTTINGPASTYTISDNPDVRASGGYSLLWPLWFAGYMDLAGEEVRAYIVRILRMIGSEMGIQQAFMLAKVTENKAEIEVWNDKAKFEFVEDG